VPERGLYDNQKQNNVEECVIGGETGICSRFLVARVSAFCWLWASHHGTAHDHRRQRGDRGYHYRDIKGNAFG
jgi:hypothetical protein